MLICTNYVNTIRGILRKTSRVEQELGISPNEEKSENL